MRNRNTWRGVAATLIVVLALAATPAVAQASTGSPAGPSWIEWVIAQAGELWQVVTGNSGTDSTGQLPDPKP